MTNVRPRLELAAYPRGRHVPVTLLDQERRFTSVESDVEGAADPCRGRSA